MGHEDEFSEFICNYYNVYNYGVFFENNVHPIVNGYICSSKNIECYIYNLHRCDKKYIWYYGESPNDDTINLASNNSVELVAIDNMYNSYLNGRLKLITRSFNEFIQTVKSFIPRITFQQCINLYYDCSSIETIYYNNQEYIYNMRNENVKQSIKILQNLVDGGDFSKLPNLSNEWIQQISMNLV